MEQELALQPFNGFRKRVQNFKALLMDTFDDYCKTGLYTLRFQPLDYVLESLGRFVCLELLSSSAHEHANVHIETAFGSTSQPCTSLCMRLYQP